MEKKMEMFNLILLSLQVRFTIMFNRLVFFLKRLPLLGKAFPQSLYGESAPKIVVMIFGILFLINMRFWQHLLYMVMLFFIGLVLSQANALGGIFAFLSSTESFSNINFQSVVLYMLTVWFLLSFVGAPLFSILVGGRNHKNDNIMINYMRADPTKYAQSRILLDRLGDIILFFPTLLLAFAIAGLPLWGAIILLAVFTSFRLFGEVVNLWLFQSLGKHLGQMPLSYIVMIPIFLLAIVGPYFFGAISFCVLFNNIIILVITVIACALLGYVAIQEIKGYPLYINLMKDKLFILEAYYQKHAAASGGGATLAVAKNWSKDVAFEDLEVDKFSHKSGFAYLNAIFFSRHSNFFRKKIVTRCLIFLAPLAAVVLLALYSLVMGEPLYRILQGIDLFTLPGYQVALYDLAPVFFFLISMVSVGRIVTLSIFSNCDIHMLHYPYYRTSKTILTSFGSRFVMILRYNLVLTTTIVISMLGIIALIYGYIDFVNAGVFFLALSIMSVFFSFSDLFLYYVIQPYDSGGKDKSFLHKAINFGLGILMYQFLFNFRVGLIPFTTGIAAAIVIYLIVGILLLKLLAPRRFKLR